MNKNIIVNNSNNLKINDSLEPKTQILKIEDDEINNPTTILNNNPTTFMNNNPTTLMNNESNNTIIIPTYSQRQ